MAGSGSQRINKEDKIYVSASELAEFDYCALSWYFTKEGYRPSSTGHQRMENGTIAHREAHEDMESGSRTTVTIAVALAIVAVVLVVLFI